MRDRMTYHRTHGASGTLTWNRWRSMIARCTMKNTKSYPRYGGRGIRICEAWLNDFSAFLAEMGECPGTDWTLERNENDGNYERGNCRWATRKEQNRNTSRNRLLEYQGMELCITEWAEETGINFRTIMTRLSKGWTVEMTLSTAVAPRKPRVPNGMGRNFKSRETA